MTMVVQVGDSVPDGVVISFVRSLVRSSDVVGVHRSQRIRGLLLVQVRDSFPDVVVIVIVVISAVPDVMG